MSKSTIDVLDIRPAVRAFLKEKSSGFEIECLEKLLGFLACKQRGRRAHENGVAGHSSMNQCDESKLFTEGWIAPVLHKMNLVDAEKTHPVRKLAVLKESIELGGRKEFGGNENNGGLFDAVSPEITLASSSRSKCVFIEGSSLNPKLMESCML